MFGYETAAYRLDQGVSKTDWVDAVILAVKDEPFIPGQQVYMVEPLQRHKRKCWDAERIRNFAIIQYRDGKRLRRKVISQWAKVPRSTVKQIQHGDIVKVLKSGNTHIGRVSGIKTRGEVKVKVPNGELVENCGITKMQLIDRPRNLAYVPLVLR